MTRKLTDVLTFDDLKRITGYSRRADVERVLAAQGIHVFRGGKGPWTTLDLVNKAGGLTVNAPDKYGPELI